jgi:hypothetical protein
MTEAFPKTRRVPVEFLSQLCHQPAGVPYRDVMACEELLCVEQLGHVVPTKRCHGRFPVGDQLGQVIGSLPRLGFVTKTLPLL